MKQVICGVIRLNVMEKGTVTKVLNDFFTVSEGEISLKKGDIVQVLEKVDRHWWYGCCGGKFGKFPGSYLVPVEIPSLEDNHELFAAVSDFPRQQDDDLAFTKGELIVGISQVNENWWYGRIDERTGIFPTTYTWQLDSKLLKEKLKHQFMNMKARVKMNMKAQLDEEMDLQEGDIVIVTEIMDKNWYRGICGSQVGIFPSAYVDIIEDNDATESGGMPHSSHFELPVKLSELSHSVSTLKNNDDIDLLALSPEAKFSPSAQTSDAQIVKESDIFADDYFKVNMPSVYNNNSESKTNKTETYNAQPSVELDIVPYGITLYPFFAQFDNELGFHEGEIVTLCRHVDRDWIEGKIDGKKGIFPKSYVNILVDCAGYANTAEENSYSSLNELQQFHCYNIDAETELSPNSFAKVLYNFDAQMDGDLTVHKDEVVWIVSKANEDWCEVRNQSGKIGLCPQNYLTPHLLSDELNSKLLWGTSFATDDLLGLFSSTEENTNNNFGNTQYAPSDGNKRKYQSHDFLQPASLSSQKGSSIEDFISKNLEMYHISAKTSNSHPSHRHSVDLSENAGFMSANADQCVLKHRLSFSPKLQEEESHSTVKQPKANSEPLNTHQSPPLQLPPVQHQEDAKDKLLEEPTSREEGEVELRCHHSETPSHVSHSHFQRQELSRQSSDRLPHRPPPPVPVPGQKPVHHRLHRAPKQCAPLSDCTVPEEKSLSGGEHSQGEDNLDVFEEKRKKNCEQRQNVITELVLTEKEYVRDLKITYEIFNLHNPRLLEARGIDVKVVFGNILEVLQVAETLLDKLQLAMKGKSEDEQCVGSCFVELADQMKSVYGQYCMNHNNALTLLEKYESVEEIQILFNKGIETLRLQVACFDMGSILIKPVQRILKYPLILNELIKCTEDSHKDKPELLNAVRTMMDVASYINEYKRRKDIVSKYLDDGNASISSRMSKISLHSVAKKSARLGLMLTSTLFGVATKDPVFDEHEFIFHTMEKTVRSFLKDVEIFLCGMHETITYQLNIGASIVHFYQESNSEAEDYHKLQQLICRRFWVEFKKIVEQRVLVPLHTLVELFEGPAILVQKRHDKLLDYDGCFAKAEKNKENRLIQEELQATKSNYEALNSQLLEELPTLNSLASEMLVECLAAFIMAQKMFSGRITKEYFALMETPFMKSSQGDAIESFAVKHSLVWNQLGRFSFSPKSVKTDTLTKRNSKTSATSATKQFESDTLNKHNQIQSHSQQAYLQSRYSHDMLYCVVVPYTAAEAVELSVGKGNIVGVIKKHDPLGDRRMWFVEDGLRKGFVPSSSLEPLYQGIHSAGPTNLPSGSTNDDVPSQERSRRSDQRKSQVGTHSPTPRLLEPPPPSYDEVVSSADSSPRSERSRTATASEHEYQSTREHEKDIHIYEEIPESATRSVYENVPNIGSGNTPGFFYAAYDFEGSGMHMLSVKSGQIVLVLQQQDIQGNPEWWFVEDRFGEKGYVPGNYLRKYEQ